MSQTLREEDSGVSIQIADSMPGSEKPPPPRPPRKKRRYKVSQREIVITRLLRSLPCSQRTASHLARLSHRSRTTITEWLKVLLEQGVVTKTVRIVYGREHSSGHRHGTRECVYHLRGQESEMLNPVVEREIARLRKLLPKLNVEAKARAMRTIQTLYAQAGSNKP